MLSPQMTLNPEKINKYLRHGKPSFKTFSMGYTKSQKETIEGFNLNIPKELSSSANVQKDFSHFGSIKDIEGRKQHTR